MSWLIEILIISLFCLGVYTLFEPWMILGPIREYIDRKLPIDGPLRWIYKPVLGCVICFASYWGSLLYFYRLGFTEYSLKYWLPVIVSVAFVNRALYGLLDKLEK